MSQAAVEYAFKTEAGGWRVTGSRVSLDSVVHAHREGLSPVAIVEEFPTLSLEQVYGAIAFYLGHQDEIDAYLKEQEARWESLRAQSAITNQDLIDRIKERASKAKESP